MGTKINLHIFPDTLQLSQAAAIHVARLSAQAIATRGSFTVALSGGSLPKLLGAALTAAPLRDQVGWSAWYIFWADERYVPQTHPDSNHYLAQKHLFAHLPIHPNQIYNPDTSLDLAQTAATYQTTLAQIFALQDSTLPRFDLILLGLGEDGHTASLFPDHPLLQETERWVAPIFDSPKPPPQRITLTLPVLNNARHVAFITAGAGKAEILPQVLEANIPLLPANLVQPTAGELDWFVDEAAAVYLKNSTF